MHFSFQIPAFVLKHQFCFVEISWASILSNLGLAIDKDVQVAIERGRIPDAALSTRMREILNKATSYRKTGMKTFVID